MTRTTSCPEPATARRRAARCVEVAEHVGPLEELAAIDHAFEVLAADEIIVDAVALAEPRGRDVYEATGAGWAGFARQALGQHRLAGTDAAEMMKRSPRFGSDGLLTLLDILDLLAHSLEFGLGLDHDFET